MRILQFLQRTLLSSPTTGSVRSASLPAFRAREFRLYWFCLARHSSQDAILVPLGRTVGGRLPQITQTPLARRSAYSPFSHRIMHLDLFLYIAMVPEGDSRQLVVTPHGVSTAIGAAVAINQIITVCALGDIQQQGTITVANIAGFSSLHFYTSRGSPVSFS